MDQHIYTKVSSYEARENEIHKVVLLFSGGLDTSVMLKWIQDNYKAQVITLTLDLGQQRDVLSEIKAKALKLGAKKAYVINAKEEFAADYLSHMIKANAAYQGNYYISTVSRYLMAKWAIAIADKEAADAVAHGCTGKGNDQVRIDGSLLTLNPNIKIIAPVREWNMSRDAEIDYALKNGIPTPARKDFPYSDDDNMWGMTWEGGEIEDPGLIPQTHRFLTATRTLDKTPNRPQRIKLEFLGGLPIKLNGHSFSLAQIIMKLNQIAGAHGVGVEHHLEDRLVGLKTRGVYEHPGAHTIVTAHKNLEKYVCTRLENELKEHLDIKFSYFTYGALWFDPAMDDLRTLNDKINQKVDGEVTVELFKGHATVIALKSPHALHHVSFDNSDTKAAPFNVQTAAPFIEVYSLQMRLAQQRATKSVLLSIGKEVNKRKLLSSTQKLAKLGWTMFATEKTHHFLTQHGITNYLVNKISSRKEPNLKNLLTEKRLDLIINIPTSSQDKAEATDGKFIRAKAVDTGVPLYTTVDTAHRHIDKLYERKFGNFH